VEAAVAGLIYIVQPFRRAETGALVWDAPAWSQDRSFAVPLSQVLQRSKSGVLTLAAGFDPSGTLSDEAEIIAGYGSVPTALVIPGRQPGAAQTRDRDAPRDHHPDRRP
jgi:hypothetical protein